MQHPRARYRIVAWRPDAEYLIAQNDQNNPSDPELWTRIDWLRLSGMPPYEWGFCFSAYKAPSAAAAESTMVAKRDTPRTGCSGFPFFQDEAGSRDAGEPMTKTEDLIRTLERTRDETLKYFSLGDADLARTYAPGKWSVRFILHHLAESETVFLYRVRRVLSEPHQVIWVYDQDAWARAMDYEHLPLDLSKGTYEPVRAAIIHFAGLHYHGSEKIQFVHSATGLRTLKDELDKVANHNEHHLAQIRTALRSDKR